MQEKEWQPRLYVLDKDAWQQQVDMERLLCNEPAGVQEFENALVLPLRNFDLPEYPHAHYYEGGFSTRIITLLQAPPENTLML